MIMGESVASTTLPIRPTSIHLFPLFHHYSSSSPPQRFSFSPVAHSVPLLHSPSHSPTFLFPSSPPLLLLALTKSSLTMSLLILSFSSISCFFLCSLSTMAWWLSTALLSRLILPRLLRWNSLKSRACCRMLFRYSCSLTQAHINQHTDRLPSTTLSIHINQTVLQ